jgi:hypothetical protein
MPVDFRLPLGARLTDKLDVLIPIRMEEEHVGWVGDHNNPAIGRLKAGVDPSRAQAELDVLQRQVSVMATDQAHEPVTLASYVAPLTERIVGRARPGLLLLLGAIASVLLIACANLANLSLTRAVGQQREAAIRSALGASQQRLVAKALIEQLLLSVTGGALGLWVAWAALAVFVRTAPIDLPRERRPAEYASSQRHGRHQRPRRDADARCASCAAGRLVGDAPCRNGAPQRELHPADECRSWV